MNTNSLLWNTASISAIYFTEVLSLNVLRLSPNLPNFFISCLCRSQIDGMMGSLSGRGMDVGVTLLYLYVCATFELMMGLVRGLGRCI